MSRLKVLFGVYPWAFDCPGGGERQLMAYKEHLENIGVQVDLYDQWNPQINKYDIFHFFSVMPGSFQLCQYVKQQGLKLVISPNLWVTEETKYDYGHEEIKALLKLADKIIVNSKMEAKSLSAVYEIPYEIFGVVYNGVDSKYFQSVSEKYFNEKYGLENTPYILNVANIENRKNQLEFLKALKFFPELKLVVIGHARDKKYLEQCIATGGSQFIFLGDLPYGSRLLQSAYKGCSFFAMPSTLETPSIAALEAAVTGAQVLITSVGSTSEYFLEYVEYIDPTDQLSIRLAIENILKSSKNDFLRKYIKSHFTWEKVSSNLLEEYKKL